uniref:Putative secreted protein n=1 Tax=Panstrongylus lignarius TaxID=156445 RepID=A0A224XUU9_9HEMI
MIHHTAGLYSFCIQLLVFQAYWNTFHRVLTFPDRMERQVRPCKAAFLPFPCLPSCPCRAFRPSLRALP